MAIKLRLTGFDELLKKIEKAGGNVDKVTEKCMKQSAEIFQSELKSQMEKANVPKHLIDKMPPPAIENEHGEISAHVGYKKGAYNPDKLSVGYKVVFMNYGTPHRREHGKIVDISDGGKIKLGFISRAKSRSKKKIYQQQENALQTILRGLQQ